MNAVPDPALWADAFALYSVGIAKRAAADVAPCDQQIVNDHPLMRKAEVITRSDQRAEVALSKPKRIPHSLLFRNAVHRSGLRPKAMVEVRNHLIDFVSAADCLERVNDAHAAGNLGENLSADFLVGGKHLPISGAAGCRCGIGCALCAHYGQAVFVHCLHIIFQHTTNPAASWSGGVVGEIVV